MSNLTQKSITPRVHAWDHFRDAMILMVVMWHCSAIYGARLRTRWFFQDQETAVLFDIFGFVGELFLLPLLFYVSGHFAAGSIAKYGAGRFLADKAKRLLIPFALGVTFLVPINFYLNRRALGTIEPGYFHYWLSMHFLNDLGPAHLWFLYVLFFFCAVHATVWTVHRLLSKERTTLAATPSEPTPHVLIAFWILAGLAMVGVTVTVGYASWTSFLGIKLFAYQPSRCTLDLCCFFLGVYGATHGWTWGHATRGRVFIWGVLFACTSMALMVFRARYGAHVDASPVLALANALLHTFATLGALVMFAMGLRLWCNRPSKPLQLFTANSYSLYIIHQPIVVWLEYMLLGVRMSAYLKFAVVFGVGLSASLLLSHFVLRRLPLLRQVL